MTVLTCTKPSKLVRRGQQQVLEASTVLVEDDRPSLTALCAVTIYCVAFPEGQQGQHNAQSPGEWATGEPGTAKSCPQLHTPFHVKPLFSPLFLLGTPPEVFPPLQRTGLLASPTPSQPFLTVSKPVLQEGPSCPAPGWSMPWGHEVSPQGEGCSPLYCTRVLHHSSLLTQCWD